MGKKILVVDDTKDIRENLSELLIMEGFTVMTASHGGEALDCLKQFAADLIITDLVMPQMDGFELIRKVRGQPALKGIPILVFSAKPKEEEGKPILPLQADGFIMKPSSSDLILQTITTLINYEREN